MPGSWKHPPDSLWYLINELLYRPIHIVGWFLLSPVLSVRQSRYPARYFLDCRAVGIRQHQTMSYITFRVVTILHMYPISKFHCDLNKRQASTPHHIDKYKPSSQNSIWSRYDLDLWPFTLKRWSAIPTYRMNCCQQTVIRSGGNHNAIRNIAYVKTVE